MATNLQSDNHQTFPTPTESPDERRRRLQRERTARSRARNGDTTCNADLGNARSNVTTRNVTNVRDALTKHAAKQEQRIAKLRAEIEAAQRDLETTRNVLATLLDVDVPTTTTATTEPVQSEPDASATEQSSIPSVPTPADFERDNPKVAPGVIATYKAKGLSLDLTVSLVGIDHSKHHPATRAWVESHWSDL